MSRKELLPPSDDPGVFPVAVAFVSDKNGVRKFIGVFSMTATLTRNVPDAKMLGGE
jgi:hypothetical protein